MDIDEKVALAKQAAEKIKGVPGVADAYVDDWNRFGSFALVVKMEGQHKTFYPGGQLFAVEKNFNLRKLTNGIRKVFDKVFGIDAGYDIRPPERRYDQSPGTRAPYQFQGYVSQYIDIDLNVY